MRCLHCMEEVGEAEVCPNCGEDPRHCENPTESLPAGGQLYNRFQVGRVLGRGGFGITYIGYDDYFDCRVAIKEYFPQSIAGRMPGSVKLFWQDELYRDEGCRNVIREARKMRKVADLPAAVKVQDVFYENNTAYITMDYVEGITLKKKLLDEGTMSQTQCAAFFFPLMDTMQLMHDAGLIHRDISPDNIMVRPDGKGVLLDLGAAKDTGLTDNHVSVLVAKNGFSPLEQYSSGGDVGPWTDVYALCATIYYCLLGKVLPSASERVELGDAIPMQSRYRSIGTNLGRVLEDGLKVKASQRIRSVTELRERMAEAVAQDARDRGDQVDFVPKTELDPKSSYVVSGPADRSQRFSEKQTPRNIQYLRAIGPQEPEKPEKSGVFARLKGMFSGQGKAAQSRGPIVPCCVRIPDPDGAPSSADPDATVCGGDETVLFDDEGPKGEVRAYLAQPGTGAKVELNRCCFLIGRESKDPGKINCMIQDPSRHISRIHAAILFDGENFYVQDVSGRNITQLNGVTLQNGVLPDRRNDFPAAYRLYEGDSLRLAEETLVFHLGGAQ